MSSEQQNKRMNARDETKMEGEAKPRHRQIIQQWMGDNTVGNPRIYALCNDGTYWVCMPGTLKRHEWVQIITAPIPQG